MTRGLFNRLDKGSLTCTTTEITTTDLPTVLEASLKQAKRGLLSMKTVQATPRAGACLAANSHGNLQHAAFIYSVAAAVSTAASESLATISSTGGGFGAVGARSHTSRNRAAGVSHRTQRRGGASLASLPQMIHFQMDISVTQRFV